MSAVFWALLILLVFLLAAFLYWQNSSLTVSQYEIPLDGLPEAFDGCRIVQLSDLHNKRFGKRQKPHPRRAFSPRTGAVRGTYKNCAGLCRYGQPRDGEKARGENVRCLTVVRRRRSGRQNGVFKKERCIAPGNRACGYCRFGGALRQSAGEFYALRGSQRTVPWSWRRLCDPPFAPAPSRADLSRRRRSACFKRSCAWRADPPAPCGRPACAGAGIVSKVHLRHA